MTKQEAIKLLKVVIFMVEEQYATEEIEQALEMAIKALEMHDDDLISRQDAIKLIMNTEPTFDTRTLEPYKKEKDIVSAIKTIPSASVDVGDYIEVLEKIIVDAEPLWICEDTPCPEWCNENCNHASIQVDCLRYLYLVKRCKYGNDQEG